MNCTGYASAWSLSIFRILISLAFSKSRFPEKKNFLGRTKSGSISDLFANLYRSRIFFWIRKEGIKKSKRDNNDDIQDFHCFVKLTDLDVEYYAIGKSQKSQVTSLASKSILHFDFRNKAGTLSAKSTGPQVP